MESRKGLRSLIPTGTLSEPESLVQEVPVDRVRPSRYQPRKGTEEEGMAELVESIRAHGILQPLVVRRRGNQLELIAGERRLEAAKEAGLQRVPVVVREASDREMLELALVENLQREDINPIDAAQAYQRLIEEFGLTQEQVAERVGKSRPAVANTLRLLTLSAPIQEMIRHGRLEEGHGKILAGIEDRRLQLRVWRTVVRRDLSVKATAALVSKLLSDTVPRGTILGGPKTVRLDPNLEEVQSRLRDRLSARVLVHPKAKGGSIEIRYADDADLDRIYSEIMG